MQHAAEAAKAAASVACHNRTTNEQMSVSESQCACVYFKAFPKTVWHAKWQTASILPPKTSNAWLAN